MVSCPGNWAVGAAVSSRGNFPHTSANRIKHPARFPAAGVRGINIAGANLFYVRKIAKVFVPTFPAADWTGNSNAWLQFGTGPDARRVRRSDYGGGPNANGYSGIAADRDGGSGSPGGPSRAAAYGYAGAGSHGNADGPADAGARTHGYSGAHGDAAADSYATAAHAHAAADELAFPGTPGDRHRGETIRSVEHRLAG